MADHFLNVGSQVAGVVIGGILAFALRRLR